MDINPRLLSRRLLLLLLVAASLGAAPALADAPSPPLPPPTPAPLPQPLASQEQQLAAAASAKAQAAQAAEAREQARLNHLIHHAQATTWRWQRVYGPRLTPGRAPEHIQGLAYKRYVLHVWRQRAHGAYLTATHPPNRSAWLCIHHYEGSWSSATGNGYYGGLQMDLTFQRNYGWWLLSSQGTADRWSPLEQIWVAERGRHVQGWGAWPNTAHMCGLI